MGTFWRTETFSGQSETQTSCDMAVIDTISLSFHGKGMTAQCHPAVQCSPT